MPEQLASQAVAATQLSAEAGAELQRLIDQTSVEMRPIIEKEADETKMMVDDFVTLVLKGKLVKGDPIKRISQAIAWLDKRLSDQLDAIIHHPEFLQLEGAWRGLDYLVKRKPPGTHLQLRVMNISKQELGAVLEDYEAESGMKGWTQSPIFKQVFENRFDRPGANPFGCMVGDYQFDKSAPDINLLRRLSAICGAAHAPFVSAGSPNLLGLKSWQRLPDPAELEAKMATPDYANWNDLRQSEDSRYLALTLPRFLARLPYSVKNNPVAGLNFEEDMRPPFFGEWNSATSYLNGQFVEHGGKWWRALRNNSKIQPGTSEKDWEEIKKEEVPDISRHDNYAWANAAYAMAANIANAFHDTCFCTAIRGVEGGGKVEGLPIDTFPTDDGGVDAKCPTEVAISQRREAELGNLGFLPLSHWENHNFAAFVGAQTVQRPEKYETPEATANAELSARLPYVFMVSRFAHYLKKMLYEWVGTNKERDQLQRELNEWIMLYATSPNSAEDVKRKKPLAEARIEVKEVEGKPGYYEAFAYLRPHIQLEAVTVNLGVVAKLPTK